MTRNFFCCHPTVLVSVLSLFPPKEKEKNLVGIFFQGHQTWSLRSPLGFGHILPRLLTVQVTIVFFTGCLVNKATDSSFYENSVISSVKFAIHANVRAYRQCFSPWRGRHLWPRCGFSGLPRSLLEICIHQGLLPYSGGIRCHSLGGKTWASLHSHTKRFSGHLISISTEILCFIELSLGLFCYQHAQSAHTPCTQNNCLMAVGFPATHRARSSGWTVSIGESWCLMLR